MQQKTEYIPDPDSPRLTMMVPLMKRTVIRFIEVNVSPENANETRNVKTLESLLKMVLDCKGIKLLTPLKRFYAQNILE